MQIVYFHRNQNLGYSINKVTQTIVKHIVKRKEYYVPKYTASLVSVICNIWYVLKHRDKNCINHITGDIHYCILGLIGCRSVLTIHDTVLVDYLQSNRIKKIIAEWLWFKIPLRLATKVICISEATKNCVMRYTKRTDINVIYNAIELNDLYSKESYRIIDKARILIIGTKANKNIERTFMALKDMPIHIIIIGKLTEYQRDILDNEKISYECKFKLSDDEIVQEYRKADVLSFISLFEGFGMPIIEANQQGLPIVCSNIPVLKEVAGDSAIFVDPYDVEQMKQGFVALLGDENLRRELVKRGHDNVKRFSAEQSLTKHYALYESLSKDSL